MRKRLWLILALGVIAFGIGVVGMLDRLQYGLRNVGYGSPIPWALWVVFYIYFIGLSAGAFLISSLVYVFGFKQFEAIGRIAVFTALIALITALLFIWVDLGHMERFTEVFARPGFHSPLAWIVWLYTAYFFLLLAEAWFLMRRSFARGAKQGGFKGGLYRILALGTKEGTPADEERDLKVVRVLGSIGVPLAIAFHGGTGTVFAVTIARAYWYSGLFPLLFLVSALASGGALLTAVAAFIIPNGYRRHQDLVISLGRLLLILLLVEVLMEVAEFLVSLYGTAPAHTAPIQEQLFGPNWWIFWLLGLVGAVGLPMLVLVTAGRRSGLAVGIVALLSAICFVGIRWNIVLPGFVLPELPGLEHALVEPHLNYLERYVPSLMEWQVSAFAVGVALILFAIGYHLLPLEREAGGETWQKQEVSQ